MLVQLFTRLLVCLCLVASGIFAVQVYAQGKKPAKDETTTASVNDAEPAVKKKAPKAKKSGTKLETQSQRLKRLCLDDANRKTAICKKRL